MKFSSKIYFVALVILISIFPIKISESCWDYDPYYVGYSILHPSVSEGKIEKPFVFTYTYFGGYWSRDDHVEKNIDKNIIEWQKYFCGKPTLEDLSFIIYKSSINDLKVIKSLQTDPNAIVPDTLKNNSFIKTFSQYKFPDFLDYLIFAKECEPHFQEYRSWSKNKPRSEAMHPLKEKGIENYKNTTDDILKLRYGFQILRLSWYLDQDVEETYNEFIKPLAKVKSVIHNLSIERLGGWLGRSKNEQKSIHGNVLLAKSLIGNLERGMQVFLGFYIKDQKEWNQTITACENDEQRSLVHYLRALEKHSIALDDMKKMYDYHPKSKALEILMTREMQKIELRYLNQNVNTSKDWNKDPDSKYGIPESYVLEYISKIKPFVKKIAKEKKCNNPSYWMMMDGYLEFLTHDHRLAQTIFADAKKEGKKGTMVYDQIELFEFANLLCLMNSMNEKMEIQFSKIIKNNKAFVRQYKGSPDFLMEKMASLYTQGGNTAKAYLCNYSIYGLKFYPNSKDAKAVLALYDKPDKNDFEKYLLEDNQIKTREELVDILGTSYLGENQIENAIETFATIPDFGKKFIDPFQVYIFEYNMKKKYPNAKEFSKYEIAQKIAELKNEIIQESTNSAAAHLALGSYEYHSSYFGFGWQIKDYFVSGTSWYEDPSEYRYYSYMDNTWVKGNKEFMNLSMARKHLKKVFELTDDQELRAKATLMLSQFEKINNSLKNRKANKGKKHQSKYYLAKFEKDYFETKFYEEYLRECAPYNSY